MGASEPEDSLLHAAKATTMSRIAKSRAGTHTGSNASVVVAGHMSLLNGFLGTGSGIVVYRCESSWLLLVLVRGYGTQPVPSPGVSGR